MLGRISLCALVALFSACASPSEAPQAVRAKDVSAPIESVQDCWMNAVQVTPAANVPVARTTPVVVSVDGQASDLKIAVGGTAGELPGNLLITEAGGMFVPAEPYPAMSAIDWRVSVCGQVLESSFSTGSLYRALRFDELSRVYNRQTWGLDLRLGQWIEPAASPLGRLERAFGGGLLLEVVPVADGALIVRLAPALTDASGVYGLPSNPEVFEFDVVYQAAAGYARWFIPSLPMPTRGGEVMLRDIDLTLGLSDEGIADARVSAELDLRHWTADTGIAACTFLGTETDTECRPCSADGALACIDLQVAGLHSAPASVTIPKEN